MKKTVLFLLLTVFALGVRAQEDFLILNLGGNFSGMAFNKNDYGCKNHKMMKGGFIGGVRYQHQFGKPYLFETALLYNESGFILDDIDQLEIYEYFPPEFQEHPFDKINFKFNYMSVPLMFGYRFGWFDRKFSIAPKIGVQLSYLTSSKMKYIYNCVENKDAFDTDNKFDVAEVCEVEFSWIWGKRVCSFVGVTQRYSFTDLNSGDDTFIPADMKMQNYQISVSVGLRIKVNKMQKSFFD